jgi:hypothetical protein
VNHEPSALEIDNNQLEEVARPARSSEEISRGIIIKLNPGDGILESVLNVLVRNLMAPSRRVDLH